MDGLGWAREAQLDNVNECFDMSGDGVRQDGVGVPYRADDEGSTAEADFKVKSLLADYQ